MTTESLETTVDESQQGLLRRIYTEEWATMGNHLTSVGISLGLLLSVTLGITFLVDSF